MPRNVEDVEQFLLDLNRTFDRTDGDLFIVSSGVTGPPIAVSVSDLVVAIRVDIGKLPEDEGRQLAMTKALLTYNGTDLLHAAYALNGTEIVLTAALELKSLDQNELAAALGDIDLALARHIGTLNALLS